jgi:foldase protein PrsA
MKKLVVGVVIAAVALSMALAACGSDEIKVPAGAVAAVGSGVVTQDQYDQIIKQAEAQYSSQPGAPPFPKEGSAQYAQLKASIVNYLVQNEVIKQKAAEMNVKVTDKQFADRMKQIVEQVGGQKRLNKLLKQQKLSREELDAQLRAQMLQEAVQQKVYADVKVSDAEIKKYFDDPANEAQFNTEESVDARHVLVKTEAQAKKVRTLLVADSSDENWAKVTKQYSTDPGTKDIGGSLGNFTRTRMVKPFSDAAFSLEVGQISQPVKSTFGWHVIEVTKKTPASKQTLEQAKPMIEQQLKMQKQSSAWTDWLKQATEDLGVGYAAGYNPAILTASPTPAESGEPAGSDTASPASSPAE